VWRVYPSTAGPTGIPQVGINLWMLAPGEPIGMYHGEADQEDFLLLYGEELLIIEGEERARWLPDSRLD
jgi:uncharacterized cupin superfamily protein